MKVCNDESIRNQFAPGINLLLCRSFDACINLNDLAI